LQQVKLLFAGEKKLCDQVFDGVDSLRDQIFAEVTVNSMALLLSFGEAVAKGKRSPEKLFVLLDMYEILRELHPEVRYMYVFSILFGCTRISIVLCNSFNEVNEWN